MNHIETLKQALEALTASWSTEQEMWKVHEMHMNAITALRTAIEQMEKQEPFGYVYEEFCLPECAVQQSWVEERFSVIKPHKSNDIRNVTPVYTHPSPAAQPAPVQEPLEYWNAVEGWVKIDEVRQHFDSVGCGTIYKNAGEDRVPLYTAAQRQWVGLTDEEIDKLFGDGPYVQAMLLRDVARAIEAKLREKNAAPVQEPDWSNVGRLVEAAHRANAAGHLTGTSNWAAAVFKYMSEA